jgi:hypothetical protein
MDELRLALQRLPHVGVERPLGDVADDLDVGVEVALAHDPAVALLDVGGPPRRVEVVQRDRALLNVRADAHLLARADQHADPAVAGRGEHLRLLRVVLRLVDVPDRRRVHPAGDELGLERVVGIPVDVRRVVDGAREVLVVGPASFSAFGVPRSRNTICNAPGRSSSPYVRSLLPRGSPRSGPRRPRSCRAGVLADQPHAQRGLPAVAADLEHVVLLGLDLPVAHGFGALAQLADVLAQLVRRGHDDGLRLAADCRFGVGRLRSSAIFTSRTCGTSAAARGRCGTSRTADVCRNPMPRA